MRRTAIGLAAMLLVVFPPGPRAQQASPAVVLLPTNHPRIPREPSALWLVPDRTRPGPPAELAPAIKQVAAGEYTKALATLSQSELQIGGLAPYMEYYAAEASLKLGRAGDARRGFQALASRPLVGYLSEAAALGEAEADEAQSDFSAATAIYERLLKDNIGAPDDLSMRLGRAAKASGDTPKATAAFARVYYEFALSELAPTAAWEVLHSPSLQAIASGNERYRLELGRAERLFGAKQYVPARAAFEGLRSSASGDDAELVRLRLAECDYYQKRARTARDGLKPYVEHASRQAEAMYFYAVASYDVPDRPEYFTAIRRVADEFPTSTWAEDALAHLANYYVQKSDDDQADAVYREMYAKFPRGNHAELAAWKVGWRAYRAGQYAETVRYFEQAAHDFPRSDYRPPWLYWSGRAHERLNEPALAQERYKLETADYFNTYHGRLAIKRLDGFVPPPRVILTTAEVERRGEDVPLLPSMPKNSETIRDLLSLNLYDDALNELRFAARSWGDSSVIQATVAWIQRQQGRGEKGSRQFDFWRGSINTMKRAYPQYLAAGGEQLPWDLQAIIFPIAYWDTIKKYSAEKGLDPFIVAAMTAQESTFVPDIKSYAGAVGLMQFMAPDAREWAKKVGLPYSASLRANADASLKMGTTYLADLVRRFDNQMYLALAAYNGGPSRTHRWIDERPGLSQEEFIDDIPVPQTQNYVKKVLATAEDYRRLYGPDAARGGEPDLDAKLASTAVAKKAAPAAAPKKPAAPQPAAKPASAKPASAKPAPARPAGQAAATKQP